MCPPASVPPLAEISLNFTDEEVVTSLDKFTHGSPLPSNVIDDVNPYHHEPSKLPDEIWFFTHSEEKKNTKLGFWKAKGEGCEVFSNSTIIGWRTTLSYYEGQPPHGQRTGWLMQEYRITKRLRDNSKPKDSRSLCRIFFSDGLSPNHEMHPKHGGADIADGNYFQSVPLTVRNTGSTSGQGSTSESQDKTRDAETGQLAVTERLPYLFDENLPEPEYFLRGDYLELNDLADSESPSSSTDNSSFPSLRSDDCFDSSALLQDIEDEKRDQQGKDASCKFIVSASGKPNAVVMHPAASGSLVRGNVSELAAERVLKSDYRLPGSAIGGKFLDKRVLVDATRSQKVVKMDEGTPSYRNVAESSSSHKAVLKGEKKAPVGRMKKLQKKKYFCFLPF